MARAYEECAISAVRKGRRSAERGSQCDLDREIAGAKCTQRARRQREVIVVAHQNRRARQRCATTVRRRDERAEKRDGAPRRRRIARVAADRHASQELHRIARSELTGGGRGIDTPVIIGATASTRRPRLRARCRPYDDGKATVSNIAKSYYTHVIVSRAGGLAPNARHTRRLHLKVLVRWREADARVDRHDAA